MRRSESLDSQPAVERLDAARNTSAVLRGLGALLAVVALGVVATSASAAPRTPIFTNAHLSLEAWKSNGLLCYSYTASGSSGFGCTPLRRLRKLQVLWAHVAASGSVMFGVADARSEQVAVQLPNGRRVAGRLRPAPAPLSEPFKFFLVVVAPNASIKRATPPLTALAFDSHGRVVARTRI